MESAAEAVTGMVRACAVDARDAADRAWLEGIWEERYAAPCAAFVRERIVAPSPGAGRPEDDPGFRLCVEAVTRAAQTQVLRQDLHRLADAVRSEGEGRPVGSTRWLAEYDARAIRAARGNLPPETLWELWEGARVIGGQRIADEVGGDLLADTAAHTAAVTVGSLGRLSRVKALATVAGALRGYTLTVWAMVHFLTRPGVFGHRMVQLALATGGVLLAVSLFVPGMPVVFTLVGVLVLLAGASAAALRTGEARGVGRRLAGAAVLAALAVAGYAWWELSRHEDPGKVLWGLAAKVLVGLLVVLLGWWVAGARRAGRRRGRSRGA
ncbi:hypothetical protein ACF068_10550 [Streptomyces sp. NPDC016309]|uniref:hypothetical protein n=1 Tax=Streptomyces sp. NPDC016309 TaxID=3364965 RepID=UPI0036FDD6B7